jgi:Putative DNA-binding domain
MDIRAIETLVTSYVEQSIQGLDKENPKFDFKATWYDLKSPKDISEFLKDTTSIVNTVGPDGFIVIGFDDRKKEFTQATFRDSKLRDSSDIINLISGKVDGLFILNTIDIEVRGNKLSIIHIPPSIDKPHVIKKYITYETDGQLKKEEENKIWVRKNSRTFPASKYDIDLMYYDRKNILPDYELQANFYWKRSVININHDDKLQFDTYLTIENTGRRSVAISQMSMTLEFGEWADTETFAMMADKYVATNLIIKSGEIGNDKVEFYSLDRKYFTDQPTKNMKHRYYNQVRDTLMRNSNLEITLANGTVIPCKLLMTR